MRKWAITCWQSHTVSTFYTTHTLINESKFLDFGNVESSWREFYLIFTTTDWEKVSHFSYSFWYFQPLFTGTLVSSIRICFIGNVHRFPFRRKPLNSLRHILWNLQNIHIQKKLQMKFISKFRCSTALYEMFWKVLIFLRFLEKQNLQDISALLTHIWSIFQGLSAWQWSWNQTR